MHNYGHTRRLPHTKLAPQFSPEVVEALDLCVIQMDKTLSTSQKAAWSAKTLVLKMYEFKGFGFFRCGASAARIAHAFNHHHTHVLVTWPIVSVVKTSYYCPNGHAREALSPPFSIHNPPKMVWCPECRRPYSHTKWTCTCQLPWHDCTKHRPCEAGAIHNHDLVQRKPSKAVSASSSAARLNIREPHAASRVI